MSTTTENRQLKLAEKTAQAVQAQSEALDLATNIINRYRSDEKKASDLVPGLVQKLRSAGLIDDGDEKQASAELSDHAGALTILNDLLDRHTSVTKAAAEASTGLGRGVDDDGTAPAGQKQASYGAVGARNFGGPPRNSDAAMLRLIGR